MSCRSHLSRWPGRCRILFRQLESASKEDLDGIGKHLDRRFYSRGAEGHPWRHHHTPSFLEPGRVRSLFRCVEDEFQHMRNKWAHHPHTHTGFAAADLRETETALSVKMDLPGLTKKDIKVQVSKERILTVSGQRESSTAAELSSGFHRSERTAGGFQRQFRLPESANTSAITAKAEDGVLSIEIQKLAPDAATISEISIA